MKRQHPLDDEFGHVPGQGRVDHADQRHMPGIGLVVQDAIDPGPQIDDAGKAGKFAQGIFWRTPDQRDIDIAGISGAVWPDIKVRIKINLGQFRRQHVAPDVGVNFPGDEDNAHQIPTTPVSSAFISRAAAIRARV